MVLSGRQRIRRKRCDPCLALLGQSKTYGKERLEAACLRGHLTGANRLHNIRSMLKNGLEQQPIATRDRIRCKTSVMTMSMASTTSINPTDQEKPMQLHLDEQLSRLRLSGMKQALNSSRPRACCTWIWVLKSGCSCC